MNSKVQITSKLLARNTLVNLIGQGVPLLVGVVTIPFIVRGLGTDSFGLLALAWMVLGYFTVFDLGLGRATTKYVAEALGKGEEDQVPRLVWTTVTGQAILGLLGALVLAGITPLLVEHVLNIPHELVGEAKYTFYLLTISIPVVLITASFRGVLEANQRFDLVNAVTVPSSALTYLLPLLGLALGFHLPGIIALILLARFGALAAFIAMDFRIVPRLRRYSMSFGLFSRLFAFGGWVTVTSIVVPFLMYFERFLIGAILSIAAVAYYSAPYEAVNRVRFVSAALTMTLFPAFSALEGVGDRQRLGTIFARSIKYTLLALGPVVIIIVIFAKDILRIWLGSEFAAESTAVLQVIALGVLISSLAQTPFALLQGIGRPALPAKFQLFELPIYVGIAWFLVNQWGITGAAGAWTLRVTLDAVLLFVFSFKVCRFTPRLFVANGLTVTPIVILVLFGITYGLKSLAVNLPLFVQSFMVIALFSLFAWFVWRNVMDSLDRGIILKMMKIWKRSESTT